VFAVPALEARLWGEVSAASAGRDR
jgi:hypothetical protein